MKVAEKREIRAFSQNGRGKEEKKKEIAEVLAWNSLVLSRSNHTHFVAEEEGRS